MKVASVAYVDTCVDNVKREVAGQSDRITRLANRMSHLEAARSIDRVEALAALETEHAKRLGEQEKHIKVAHDRLNAWIPRIKGLCVERQNDRNQTIALAHEVKSLKAAVGDLKQALGLCKITDTCDGKRGDGPDAQISFDAPTSTAFDAACQFIHPKGPDTVGVGHIDLGIDAKYLPIFETLTPAQRLRFAATALG